MGFDERVDRDGVIQTCKDLLRFQALFAKHFALGQVEAFGADGEATARAALRRYGEWRGAFIKKQIAAKGLPLTARTIAENWDSAEYHLYAELGTGAIEGNDREVSVTVSETPEFSCWRDEGGGPDLARLYLGEVLPAMARALGATVSFDLNMLDLARPWSVTWRVDSAADRPRSPVHSRLYDRTDDAVEVAKRSSMNNGALYYFCADEQTKRFDWEGERALRRQVQALGIERVDRLIAQHDGRGWPRDLLTLTEHWDGALVSIWQFAPGRIAKDGAVVQTCTWCPYAEAWAEFGQRALDLGYLYDYEVHPTMFKRYHPEILTRMEAIKTRGDAVCTFHFTQPSKLQPGDPTFAGYGGRDV